jgi:GT2 family glycosyltransferase
VTTPGSAPVSVIVLTYNAREFVERCLDPLFEQTYPNFEVIVVDNASADGTADFVSDRFPNARLIRAPHNDGYGAGNNRGANVATGEVLVFLNPDAIPEHDWLSQLVGSMQRHRRQFATSKITLLSDRQRLNSGGNLIHYLGLSFCRGLKADRSKYDTTELVSGASGAACAISRELFERIGGFDASFFLYHDDVDLSMRALLAGEPCLYVPDAVVAHDYDLSVPPMKWGWIEAHRYAILLKVFKFRTLVVLLPALAAIDIMTFAYLATRGPTFVAPKLRSYGWVASHAASILTNRRRAQAVRVFSDRQILAALVDQIPYEQLARPELARLVHALVDPWFRFYRRLAISVISW